MEIESMINTDNDVVVVYQHQDASHADVWDWRRVDGARIVSTSHNQGYVSRSYAMSAAQAYNQDLPPAAFSFDAK